MGTIVGCSGAVLAFGLYLDDFLDVYGFVDVNWLLHLDLAGDIYGFLHLFGDIHWDLNLTGDYLDRCLLPGLATGL